MSVTIDGLYLGNKKLRLLHQPSGAAILTDAPRDNFGEGSAFSPTDLVAAGLGACMATLMGIYADRSGLDLTGMRLRVEKHMQSEPRRIGRLLVDLHLPQLLPAEDRLKLERVARDCPVVRSLHPEVSLEIHFFYDA
jgi:uncharacterized OsmC-like protein